MQELMVVMLQIGVMWLGWMLLCVGIGAGVWRILRGVAPARAETWLLAYWLGLAGVIGALQVWHLFAAVGVGSLVLLLMLSAAGWAGAWRNLWALRKAGSGAVFYALAGLFIFMFAANNAILEPKRYDAGLYQIQSVMWTNAYPIVNGLGNLHGRLGFNNSFHLYIAQMNVGIIDGRGMHLANGVPLLMLAAGGLLAVFRYVQRARTDAYTLYWMLALPLALRHLFQISLYSPDNDLLVLLVGYVTVGLLVQMAADPQHTDRAAHFGALGLLLGVGVTFKLSFATQGALFAVAALLLHLRDRQALRKPLIQALVGALLLVGVWMARGVLLTGYPLYPATVLPFAVDWRMLPEVGAQEAAWVRAWARQPYVEGTADVISMPMLEGYGWLRAWLLDTLLTTPNLFDVTLPLGLAAAALTVKLARRDAFGRAWLPALPLIVSLLVWFWIAPSPRFAGVAFWGLAAVTLGALATETPALGAQRINGGFVAVALLCFITLPIPLYVVFPAEPDVFYALPTATTQEVTSDYGAVYFAPVGGDQCWDAPLPCGVAYGFMNRLCEREVGNLRAGYAMAGVPNSACGSGAQP